jgi:hypothetical protein
LPGLTHAIGRAVIRIDANFRRLEMSAGVFVVARNIVWISWIKIPGIITNFNVFVKYFIVQSS